RSDHRRLRFEDWVVDLATRELHAPDGVVVALSGAEFKLLSVFAEHPNRVLDRNQLMDLTVGRDGSPFDRSIDVQVSRLRLRLRDDAREPRIIKTVRNEGYVLAAAVERLG
ncbi:MAG TPA: winged helix-turn-helix domain-containing protein, partial [Burkholderiales bacterium]|nr:winged helix-turn-helix domain-containing protein [Burkholderiales bacterium]